VTEIMSQREGGTGAYDQFGQEVQVGTQLFSPGWNTSGVGPGTRGYRGQGPSQGYSFENQGTAQSKGRSNYSPYFGGLNEFYQNQQTAGQWDQMQGRANMDRSDAIGSRMGQMSQFAAGRGDYETADVFASALADRAAQRMAAQSGVQDPWIGRSSYGNGAPQALPGSQADINSFSAVGEMPQPEPSMDLDPNSPEVQAMLDQAALRGRDPIFRYGTGSSTSGQNIGPFGTNSTFTNAQGSIGPGGTRTNFGGVQSGPAFFQSAADRQGTRNAFAQPGPGYDGTFDTSQDIGQYGRLMAVRNKLRK
jgi:hypothetical protein